MSESALLLEKIEEVIVGHGGDLGGWTKLQGDELQVFDGRVTLRAEVHEGVEGQKGAVHAHVYATLHEHEDEVLDACLYGMGEDTKQAIGEAAFIFLTCVAGPIRSFIDAAPVCMTSQAGVQNGDPSEGYSPGDYGLTNMHAYVGPSLGRGIQDDMPDSIDDTKPWFRYAAESAAPRRVHLAKATVLSRGAEGWTRELEIDGHEISHHDANWPAGVLGPDFGYLIRYAVFEFPRNSNAMAVRKELERAIRRFIELFKDYDDIDQLMQTMIMEGFNGQMVYEVESISTIAFGRVFFERHGVQYSPTIIRARANGDIETDVILATIPAFSRGRAIAAELYDSLAEEEVRNLAFYNAESRAILNAIEAAGDREIDFASYRGFPCVVPEPGVTESTMQAALAMLESLIDEGKTTVEREQKKPWWKFWR